MGLPPRMHVEAAVEKAPMAPTVRLTFPGAPAPPLVLSSTTTMSLPELVGAPGVRDMTPAPAPGASTTKACVLETAPFGFCSATERFPASCRSGAPSELMHCVAAAQEVGRALPATRIVEPGPGEDGAKLFPLTSSVKPPCDPA